jgi:hypothetical protein
LAIRLRERRSQPREPAEQGGFFKSLLGGGKKSSAKTEEIKK